MVSDIPAGDGKMANSFLQCSGSVANPDPVLVDPLDPGWKKSETGSGIQDPG